MSEIVPDHLHREAFLVRTGPTEQSWVDLDHPLRVEFEYMQRIVELLEITVLARPPEVALRCLHIGGGGLSLPRYIEARRPGCRQVVLEPDGDLIEQVRRRLPLPRRHGIKVRITDGRSGLGDMAPASHDLIVVDAFDGACVPAELATVEFFSALATVLAPGGLVMMNVGDKGPFDWGRRWAAAASAPFRLVAVAAEAAVWKGRRYGNLVLAASQARLPLSDWEAASMRASVGYKVRAREVVEAWIAHAPPFIDGDTQASLDPVALGWLP